MNNCEHKNFESSVRIGRLTTEEEPDVVSKYMADIKIQCADCKLPFEFMGVPNGMSFFQPMLNIDNTEMRAPLKPSTDPVEYAKVIINQTNQS
jgi:hypothetical protein